MSPEVLTDLIECPSSGHTFIHARPPAAVAKPGSMAVAVMTLSTGAEGEAASPAARAPLNTAC